jgi:hypothetical protein
MFICTVNCESKNLVKADNGKYRNGKRKNEQGNAPFLASVNAKEGCTAQTVGFETVGFETVEFFRQLGSDSWILQTVEFFRQLSSSQLSSSDSWVQAVGVPCLLKVPYFRLKLQAILRKGFFNLEPLDRGF